MIIVCKKCGIMLEDNHPYKDTRDVVCHNCFSKSIKKMFGNDSPIVNAVSDYLLSKDKAKNN
jgi:DNA-directed RNA polymerase subunit RPC12/RpoP